MGSSISSGGVRQVGARWWGVGLGAGVGGEAGADGSSGFGIDCGMEVLGVRGGLGWACCMESLRRDDRPPTATGAGGGFASMVDSLSKSNEAAGT